MDNITAFRDGKERTFTRKQWEVMGIGNCGWKEVPQVPKEVAHTGLSMMGAAAKEAFEDASRTQSTQTRKRRKK